METRRIGTSDLEVSIAGLGCNNFGMRIDRERSIQVVNAALDAGITLFDTARSYGGGRSEEFLGAALKKTRDRVVLATKFGARSEGSGGATRRAIIRSLETSLSALDSDYIDLFQLHFPDPDTPLEETLHALDELIRSGKVRYAGCSNFAGWMIADADWLAATQQIAGFVSAQNEWSLLQRDVEVEVAKAAAHFEMSILPYFPLASGLLTGKMRSATPPKESRLSSKAFGAVITERNLTRVERLRSYAEGSGWSLTRLALSWLASQPVVGSVIAGATSQAQVRENAASTLTDLTREQIRQIGDLVDG